MRRILLLIFAIGLCAAGDAGALPSASQFDSEEEAQKRQEGFMKEAADFRLARAVHVSTPAEEQAVVQGLAKAEDMRVNGGAMWSPLTWFKSRSYKSGIVAEDAFAEYPFAANSGKLLHYALDRYAENGSVSRTHDMLMQLWYKLPDYPNLGPAMTTALDLAERMQNFEKTVDLTSEDPAQVVRITGNYSLGDLDDLLRFLSRNGDRSSIAPRAMLALARTKLLSEDREERWAARRIYEDFLDRFPDSDLAFDAILEQALSWMVTYKGADYDIGALLSARDLVELAELEVGNDPGRAAKIASYRRRLSAWLQDRDLSVASWYAERNHPLWLAWLRRPTGLKDGDGAARYYARQVIARNRASPQGAQAGVLLQQLPAPEGIIPTEPGR